MAKKSGEIFDAKNVKLGKLPGRNTPKIVGAAEITSAEPKTLDSHSPVESTEIEATEHMEKVTVRSHVRSKPLRPDEPDVRVRSMDRAEREKWDKTRRGEEE